MSPFLGAGLEHVDEHGQLHGLLDHRFDLDHVESDAARGRRDIDQSDRIEQQHHLLFMDRRDKSAEHG